MAKPKKKMTAAEKASARVPEQVEVEEEPWRPSDEAIQAAKPTRKERRGRFLLLLVGLVLLLLLSLLSWTCNYSHETDVARASMASTEDMPVTNESGWIAFGNTQSKVGFVLYPGAKVAPEAYAPLLRQLAEDEDALCVVTRMPANFALLNAGAIESVMEAYPQVNSWYIAGHSLGGVAACQWASANAERLEGVVLLASYSDRDLAATNLRVLSIYGTNDKVMDVEAYEEAKSLLPADAAEVVLEGANHAQFGTYGAQGGDGDATISADEQRDSTVKAIADWMAA